MRIVFLDIDGVLNNKSDCDAVFSVGDVMQVGFSVFDWHSKMLEKSKIDSLNYLVAECEPCSIVISSSWRLTHPIEELIHLMKVAGFRYANAIIGTTPNEPTAKHESIKAWIDKQSNYNNYCAIDDDYLFDVCPTVRTTVDVGLTRELADEVVRLLTK